MGGKGGDGGGGGIGTDPELAQLQRDNINSQKTEDPVFWEQNYGEGGKFRAQYLQLFPEEATPAVTEAAAPAAAPAPAAAAAAPAAPAAEEAAPVVDTGPPRNDALTPSISGGDTAAADPAAPGGAGSMVNSADGAGNTLGGAVLKPPKYWTGNINNFKTGSASRNRMTTTQT